MKLDTRVHTAARELADGPSWTAGGLTPGQQVGWPTCACGPVSPTLGACRHRAGRSWEGTIEGNEPHVGAQSEVPGTQHCCPQVEPGARQGGTGAPGSSERDSRAAATSAYCWSSLMISGLSGETGRASLGLRGFR